jgi:hypothetical protein
MLFRKTVVLWNQYESYGTFLQILLIFLVLLQWEPGAARERVNESTCVCVCVY